MEHQLHLLGLRLRHRCRKRQHQISNRQATGVRAFTLALQLCRKGWAHLVIQCLRVLVAHPAGHLYAGAIHQLHAAACGQTPVALQRHITAFALDVQGFEHCLRLAGIQQAHRNALAHTFSPAMHVLLQAGGGGCAVELEYKGLRFIHGFIRGRPCLNDGGPSNFKLIASSARQHCTGRRFE